MSFALFCHYLLAWILAIAALQKCRAWQQFVSNLQQVLPLSHALAALASVVLIASEALLAALLWLPGPWWVFSGWLTLALFIAFSMFIGWLLASGRDFSCQCFGRTQQPLGRADLYRSALLLTLVVAMLPVDSALLAQYSRSANVGEQLLLLSCALLWALQLIAMPQWWPLLAGAKADDSAASKESQQ